MFELFELLIVPIVSSFCIENQVANEEMTRENKKRNNPKERNG